MTLVLERPLVFDCSGKRLTGILHPGAPDAVTGVVIVVGGPQYRVGSHRQFVLMARQFAAAGFPVLRFDYRGMGDAEGTLGTFDNINDDIRAAIDCFKATIPPLINVVLLGLCDAASAILIYGHTDDRVSGLILLNPWVRTTEGEAKAYLRHYYLQRLLQKSFWRKVLVGRFAIRRSWREYLETRRAARDVGDASDNAAVQARCGFITRMLAGLQSFSNPILLLTSGRDLTAQEFSDLCRDDKRWKRSMARAGIATHAIEKGDHTWSTRGDLASGTAVVITWLHEREHE